MKDTALDQTLFALADPTRRAILQRLSKGEARVTDIAEPFEISLNSVSKHIQLLERANLVVRRREGRDHFIRLSTERLDDLIDWMESHRSLWSKRLDRLEEVLRKRKKRR